MSRRGRSSPKFSLFAFQDIITSVTGIVILITLILALELMQRKENSPPRKTEQVNSQVQTTIAQNQASIQELKGRLQLLQGETSRAALHDVDRVRQQLEDLAKINDELEQELGKFRQQQQDADNQVKDAANILADQPESKTIKETTEAAKTRLQILKELKDNNRVVFNPTEGPAKSPWLVEFDGADIKVAEVGKSAPPQIFSNISQLQTWAMGRNKNSEYFVLLPKPAGLDAFRQAKDALRKSGFEVSFDLLGPEQTAIHHQTGAAVE